LRARKKKLRIAACAGQTNVTLQHHTCEEILPTRP
jgi:hypothetical protein